MLKVKINLDKIEKSEFFNTGNLITSKKQLNTDNNDLLGVYVFWSCFSTVEGLLIKKCGDFFELKPVEISTEISEDELEIIKEFKEIQKPSIIQSIYVSFFDFYGNFIEECDTNTLRDLFKFILNPKNNCSVDIWGDMVDEKQIIHIDIFCNVSLVLEVTSYYNTLFFEGYFINKSNDEKLSSEKISFKYMSKFTFDKENIFDILDNIDSDTVSKIIYELI